METFYESLSVQSKDLLRTAPVSPLFKVIEADFLTSIHPTLQPAPDSLEVSIVVRDSLLQLKEILLSHDMSLVSSGSSNSSTTSTGDTQKDKMDREERLVSIILESFIEPLVQISRLSSEELDKVEGAIYLVNTFHSVQVRQLDVF